MKLVPIIQYIGDHNEQHHFIKRLDVQAQELLGLVERVLSFNDVSSGGGQDLNLTEHAVESIFPTLFEKHAAKAQNRNQELSVLYEVTTATLLWIRTKSSPLWISYSTTHLSSAWRAVK